MVQVMRQDRTPPPLEVGQADGERPEPACPGWSCSFVGSKTVSAAELCERLAERAGSGHLQSRGRDSSACPGAAALSARAVTGLMPGRGGRFAGSLMFQASPSISSN
jgi:hypothetical protein